jgi:hypothetical protein
MATAKKKPIKAGASSGHITNLKQSILETFDIYEKSTSTKQECKSSGHIQGWQAGAGAEAGGLTRQVGWVIRGGFVEHLSQT